MFYLIGFKSWLFLKTAIDEYLRNSVGNPETSTGLRGRVLGWLSALDAQDEDGFRSVKDYSR
jgi:hypothetical protein